MTEFKKGDKVRLTVKDGSFYECHSGKLGTVGAILPELPYPVDVLLEDGTQMAVNHSELTYVRPTAKEEILNLKAQVVAIRDAAVESETAPEAIARAKGIIEGLDAALAFIYDESLPEEDRVALDAIDGGADPW